jgi:two-component system CheB/CheR fusion protein
MNKSFYTVGLGASAGGQSALSEFFDHLSPEIEVALVVVTHLMRDRKSILASILAKHTSLPVLRVETDVEVRPGHIYVLPENTALKMDNGWLRVSERDEKIENCSVNIFFESLAEDFREKAVGIVFSGAGKDGLQGALKITELGGKVLVQDPDTALAYGMPTSVIEHDHIAAFGTCRKAESLVY